MVGWLRRLLQGNEARHTLAPRSKLHNGAAPKGWYGADPERDGGFRYFQGGSNRTPRRAARKRQRDARRRAYQRAR